MGYLPFIRANAVFLLAGFLLTFTSSFGQTYFISIFAGEIKTEFGLSDGQWGGLYTIATSASALVMVWAGVLSDQFRVRSLAVAVCIGLALACIAMGIAASWLGLVIVIFALRFTGQGMMSHLGAVAMVRWFEAARGKALSVASMGFSVGQAFLPVAFVALLALFDWRVLWMLAALCVLAMIPLMWFCLKQERTPQSLAEETQATGLDRKHWSRFEAIRCGLFWLMVPSVIGPGAWGTALFFHQVHLTEVKGWSLLAFVSLMPLYMVSTILATVLSGWAIDRFGINRIVSFQMLPYALSFVVLAVADTLLFAAVGLMIFGVGQGMQSTGTSTFWAEYFGTRHIGAIKSAVTAIMVLGSALGPGITGALIDAGVDLPAQMVPISVYYVIAAGLTVLAVMRYSPRLSLRAAESTTEATG